MAEFGLEWSVKNRTRVGEKSDPRTGEKSDPRFFLTPSDGLEVDRRGATKTGRIGSTPVPTGLEVDRRGATKTGRIGSTPVPTGFTRGYSPAPLGGRLEVGEVERDAVAIEELGHFRVRGHLGVVLALVADVGAKPGHDGFAHGEGSKPALPSKVGAM
jgi:hypothetical protein